MITRSLPSLRLVLTSAACIVSLAACGSDDVGDDGTTGSTGATSMSSSASDSATSGSSSTADATSGPTTDASDSATSDDTTSTSDDTTSTSDATGTATDDPTTSTSGDTTGVVQSGLEAFCSHYVDCGGTYYEDEADCVDASLSYWGECPSRREAQDVFGECMAEIPCDEWNPDAYNPNNTVCAEQWQALGDSEPC